MAKYRISGVLKDSNDTIVTYAFHTIIETSTGRAVKKTKAQAIALLEVAGNSATTWVWNYLRGGWDIGETVTVVKGSFKSSSAQQKRPLSYITGLFIAFNILFQ